MTEKQEEVEHKKKMDIYIRHLEKHVDKSKERYEYAIKQFDTLMIGLSTVGIGFVANYIKELHVGLTLAYISQFGFVTCFFMNLFSHLASMKCNKSAMLNAKQEYEAEAYGTYENDNEGLVKYEIIQELRRKEIQLFGSIVRVLNVLSFLSLVFAVVCFIVFAYNK